MSHYVSVSKNQVRSLRKFESLSDAESFFDGETKTMQPKDIVEMGNYPFDDSRVKIATFRMNRVWINII